MPKPSDAKVVLQLRLNAGLHKELKTIAEMEFRSLNAQIEYFLNQGAVSYYDEAHLPPTPSGLSGRKPSLHKLSGPDRAAGK